MNPPPTPSPARPAWKTPLIVLALIVLAAVAVVGVLWWWINRPITPVTLSPPEKQVLERKIERLAGDPPERLIAPGAVLASSSGLPADADAPYLPGAKSIVFTQRELNGLLEMNGFGDRVKIVLANDAVHTRIQTDIPEDFPVMGGKTLKARARFLVADHAGGPALIVDDVTVWGVSLPNAWLGDIKGENLFELVSPDLHDNVIARGIEGIKVGNGRIVIDLAE